MKEMEQESIIENNKTIAEFMGVKTKVYSDTPTVTYWDFNGFMKKESDMKYHTSWDWLMPVVEKIRTIGFKFIIGDSNRVTVYNKDYDWRNGSTSDSMIECVWHGCAQFIQWYNTQST